MTFVQQLLVAPAALGLIAPLAVVNSPAAQATELNINDVSDYAATASGNSLDQVTSVSQFSDVYPTDWAYQALANLVEIYGCVAGYPNGNFRGNRAITRYEAAALLNACLERITEVTDELRRLLKEFETELAILKGRVDGLEARVANWKPPSSPPPPNSRDKPPGCSEPAASRAPHPGCVPRATRHLGPRRSITTFSWGWRLPSPARIN